MVESVAMAKRPQAPHDIGSEIPFMKPAQQFYNEEAQRISDLIDEELKVCRLFARGLPCLGGEGGGMGCMLPSGPSGGMARQRADDGNVADAHMFVARATAQEGCRAQDDQRCVGRIVGKHCLGIDNVQLIVMLLGQAESGKSTLQKQFQLYHARSRMDDERPSWKPVVHFNVIKAIRMILDELDYDITRAEYDVAYQPAASSSSATLDSHTLDMREIGALRERLVPLIALEASLTSELNGGVSVSGTGLKGSNGGVFVRSGWQNLLKNRSVPEKHAQSTQVVAHLAARTLYQFWEDVMMLWKHPAVRKLQKLKLEDSAPL